MSRPSLAAIEYQLSHQSTAPTIDGILDEPQWDSATVIEAKYETSPLDGVPTPIKTFAYAYEDGRSLHFAIHALDPEPSKIRAHLLDRDSAWHDDLVGIVVDTFNDERAGYEFYVNPMGAQIDARIRDNNGREIDDSWNAIWYGAAKITKDGWVAEISVPFRALRFPGAEGQKTWGIALLRRHPREINRWTTDYARDGNVRCHLCQFNKISGFEKIEAGKNFQLTPTVTFAKNDSRDSIPGEWETVREETEAGIDLRWGVTQNSVINATINPDFSQVETDAAQLDVNTTFSLFLPERRPFFLDGADYFASNSFEFVHTRNIADPDYGVKITGKADNHWYGVMRANSKSTAFLIPGNQSSDVVELTNLPDSDNENDAAPMDSDISIARYKVDVGELNNVGGLITHREGTDYKNTLVSLDGDFWLSKKDLLRYQFAHSESRNPISVQEEYSLEETQSDAAWTVNYVRSTRDYRINANYAEVGSDFRADMGFIVRADYKELEVGGQLKKYGAHKSFLSRYYYNFDWNYLEDFNGNKLEEEFEISAEFEGRMQSTLEIALEKGDRFYQNDFNTEGEIFSERAIEIEFELTPQAGFKLEFEVEYGEKVDFANAQPGNILGVESEVDISLGRHLSFELVHNYRTFDVDGANYLSRAFEPGTLFTADQFDLRVNYQFSIQSQLKLVLQYTDVDRAPMLYRANFDSDPDNDVEKINRDFSSQLLYSYKMNPQSLFFLGYADGGFQDYSLTSLERNQRSVFAKISYAWQS